MRPVRLHPAVLADIATHVLLGMRRHPREERMGMLFGITDSNGWAVTAYAPYRGGYRGKDFVEYREERLYRRARLLESVSEWSFLGLYHSHPLRYDERIPTDLVAQARASILDRRSFMHAWPYLRPLYKIDAIVAVGPARQAPAITRFRIIECMPNALRHRGRLWSIHVIEDRTMILWMPGRVRAADEPGCCRFSRQFSWFLAASLYTRESERTVLCSLAIDWELPYGGRVIGRKS